MLEINEIYIKTNKAIGNKLDGNDHSVHSKKFKRNNRGSNDGLQESPFRNKWRYLPAIIKCRNRNMCGFGVLETKDNNGILFLSRGFRLGMIVPSSVTFLFSS